MQWFFLLLLVSAILVPTVMLCGFAGCGAFAASNPPGAPTGLAASGASESSISLTWTFPQDPSTLFKVFRGSQPDTDPLDESNPQPISTGPNGGPTNYTDGSLPIETTFIYRVKASNGDGDSPFSDKALGTTLPKAPTTLTVSGQSSTQIDLTWTKNSKTNLFQVGHRSPPSVGDFTALENVTGTQYSHKNLSQGTVHEYRVAAVIAGTSPAVLSAFSNTVQATTTATPPPSFKTAFPTTGTATIDEPQTGVEKFCLVQRIDHSLLSNSGTQIKITLKGPPPGSTLTIDSIYISRVAPAGDPYDSPPAIAAGGLVRMVDKSIDGSALSVPPAGITVGPVAFNFDPAQDLLVAFDISDAAGTVIRNGNFPGAMSFAKPNANEAGTADRSTGFTPAPHNLYLITKIEVA